MSSIAIAVPFAVASSAVFGTTLVIQHRVSSQHSDNGEESAKGLLALLRHPIFLLSICGDLFAFLLQIIALATGPVVIIQPLVVLILPFALGVSVLMGGHRIRKGDWLGLGGVLGGLAAFLLIIGRPGGGHVPHTRYMGIALGAVVVSCAVVGLAVAKASRVVRAATYGAIAGAFAGTLAVMVDAASDRFSAKEWYGLLETPRGLVPLAGIVICGAGSLVMTQVSFQIGALHATLPANLSVDPLVAVLLGATLLREHIPMSPFHLVAYLVALGMIVAGAIRLADPEAGPIEPDVPVQGAT